MLHRTVVEDHLVSTGKRQKFDPLRIDIFPPIRNKLCVIWLCLKDNLLYTECVTDYNYDWGLLRRWINDNDFPVSFFCTCFAGKCSVKTAGPRQYIEWRDVTFVLWCPLRPDRLMHYMKISGRGIL